MEKDLDIRNFFLTGLTGFTCFLSQAPEEPEKALSASRGKKASVRRTIGFVPFSRKGTKINEIM